MAFQLQNFYLWITKGTALLEMQVARLLAPMSLFDRETIPVSLLHDQYRDDGDAMPMIVDLGMPHFYGPAIPSAEGSVGHDG
jgi:hypothetical protein